MRGGGRRARYAGGFLVTLEAWRLARSAFGGQATAGKRVREVLSRQIWTFEWTTAREEAASCSCRPQSDCARGGPVRPVQGLLDRAWILVTGECWKWRNRTQRCDSAVDLRGRLAMSNSSGRTSTAVLKCAVASA